MEKVKIIKYVLPYRMFHLKTGKRVPEKDYNKHINYRIKYENTVKLNKKIIDLIKLLEAEGKLKLLIIRPMEKGFDFVFKRDIYDLSKVNEIIFYDYYLRINKGEKIFYDGIIGFKME